MESTKYVKRGRGEAKAPVHAPSGGVAKRRGTADPKKAAAAYRARVAKRARMSADKQTPRSPLQQGPLKAEGERKTPEKTPSSKARRNKAKAKITAWRTKLGLELSAIVTKAMADFLSVVRSMVAASVPKKDVQRAGLGNFVRGKTYHAKKENASWLKQAQEANLRYAEERRVAAEELKAATDAKETEALALKVVSGLRPFKMGHICQGLSGPLADKKVLLGDLKTKALLSGVDATKRQHIVTRVKAIASPTPVFTSKDDDWVFDFVRNLSQLVPSGFTNGRWNGEEAYQYYLSEYAD